MTSFLRENFVFIAESAVLMLLLKSTLILAVGLLLLKFSRSVRASLRHLALACTFAVVLVLPVATLLAPPLRLEVPDSRVVSTELVAATAEVVAATVGPNVASSKPANSTQQFTVSIGAILFSVWTLGAALVLFKLASSLWKLRTVRRSAIPSLEVNQIVQELSQQAGVRHSIEVLLHDGIDVPMTYGFVRPVILLPIDAGTWNETELHQVFVHELEHIKRFDWSVQVMARVACAVYWFQPLVWMAWRKLCLEAEKSCDDAVLVRSDQADYAEHLLSLARRLSNTLASPVLSMANRSDLSRRVSSILDTGQVRGRAGSAWIVVALVLSFAAVSAIAPDFAVTRTYGQTVQSRKVTNARSDALNEGLLKATEAGKENAIKELLDAGADINGVVHGDGTALIVAAREGYKNIVELLLERGADPNLAASGDGSPLIMAAREGHDAIAELLIGKGAQVNQIVEGDESALIQASSEGRLSTVKLLISRGADVNLRAWSGGQDGEWRTALIMARRNGHSAVAETLVQFGARE
jgi:bla regulator protein blaR1